MAYFYISMYKYTSWSHWDYDYFCLNYEKQLVLICLLIEQICSLEYTADELKDRCQTLYKGSKKFMYVSFLFLDSLILLLVALPIRNAWIQFLSIIIFEIMVFWLVSFCYKIWFFLFFFHSHCSSLQHDTTWQHILSALNSPCKNILHSKAWSKILGSKFGLYYKCIFVALFPSTSDLEFVLSPLQWYNFSYNNK